MPSSADNAGPPPPRPRGGAVSVAVALPSDWTLNERQMCDLEMILSGAFAPLEGFMTLADYQSVLDSMTLANGEIFPLPVVLSIPKSCCGETAATNVYWMSTATSIINNQGKMMLRDAVGTVIAQLDVESVYLPDIEEEMDKVLGTRDTNHPYVRYLLENHKESYYVGGRIKEINKIIHYNYINYRLSPIACKEKIKEKKNNKIVIGFQTRNPIHRSHYELIKHALYIVANKEKKQPILLLSPVIGPTQPGDIPYYIRTRCYEHVLRYFIQDKQCIFNHLDNTATSTPNRSPPRYQPGEEEEEQEGEEEQQQQQHQQQQQQEKQEEQENIIREEIIKREGIEEKKEEEKEGKEGEGKGGKAGGEEGGGEEEEEEEGGINNNKNYNAMLVLIPLAMRMAGPRECILHALIRKNYGCTHFIVGRDHAGPSTTKQDGTPFYGPYDAHKLLGLYADKLGIIPIFGEEMLYIGEENKGYYIQERYIKEIKKNKPNILINKLSGTQLRYKLINRLFIPSWFSFPDVIHELKSFYKQNHQRGLCVYFTGLPCSGKSTLANALEARILENNKERRRITLLDADVVRQHLSKGLGFNKEDRSTNVRRIGYIASEITKHGGICIVANIAPYNTDRLFNRKLIEQEGGVYVEVYVCTPLSVCEERDIKDLYKKARKGIIKQFTGVSDPYEVPTHPELTIDSSTNIKDKVTRIHQYLIDQGYVLPPSSSSSYSSSCSPTDKE